MRYVSFFSGALGLDVGLEQAGWIPVCANEFDPVACRTIRKNRPDLPLLDCDIRDLSADSTFRFLAHQQLDAVVGGPPCQAFSTAGKRQGLNDERGNVFLHFVRLAIDLAPRFVVVENVRGLLSAPLVHRPHSERGEEYPELRDEEKRGGALRLILSLFEEAGYSVSFRLYDTSRFGVPQVRERVVLIAYRGTARVPHLNPLDSEPVTLAEALTGMDGVEHETLPLRAKMLPYLPMIGPGENWRALPEELQREALGGVYDCTGGRTGFLRRVAWDKPAPTLVTSPTMPATLLAHPEETRALSVQEYARLQTFPDDWVFCGKTAQKYKQIGNAVPVRFGRAIGEHIMAWEAGRVPEAEPAATSRYAATDDRAWRASVAV